MLRQHLLLPLTGIKGLLADEPLRVGATCPGDLSTARVDAPALALCRVALLRAEVTALRALRHVRRRSVSLASLYLLLMTVRQNAHSTRVYQHRKQTRLLNDKTGKKKERKRRVFI